MSGILTRYALRMTAGKRKLLGRFLIITKPFRFSSSFRGCKYSSPRLLGRILTTVESPAWSNYLAFYLFHVPNCTQKAAGELPAAFVACCALSRFCIAFTLLTYYFAFALLGVTTRLALCVLAYYARSSMVYQILLNLAMFLSSSALSLRIVIPKRQS